MTRSGDFPPKNASNFGYFPANLQKFWAIFRQIAKVWAIPLPKFRFWHFLELFGYFWGHNLVALFENETYLFAELSQLEDLNTNRITRILTTDFPQYFAIVSRIRQEVHAIGPEGNSKSL